MSIPQQSLVDGMFVGETLTAHSVLSANKRAGREPV